MHKNLDKTHSLWAYVLSTCWHYFPRAHAQQGVEQSSRCSHSDPANRTEDDIILQPDALMVDFLSKDLHSGAFSKQTASLSDWLVVASVLGIPVDLADSVVYHHFYSMYYSVLCCTYMQS